MVNIFLNSFIKLLGIYFCVGFSYFKITNCKIKYLNLFIVFIVSILLSFINSLLYDSSAKFLVFLINSFIYTLILSKITQNKLGYSIICTVISVAIAYITFGISTPILSFIWTRINPYNYYTFLFVIINLIDITLIYLIFKIKRLKFGLPFFNKKQQNDYFDVIILMVSVILIFVAFTIHSFAKDSFENMYLWIIFFSIILFVLLQKAIIVYNVQKLQYKALKDYEQELTETKQKLATAIEEKQKLVKSNHEFYHRQEALNKKLDDLIQQTKLSVNSEFSEEFGDLTKRINTLSDEYISKIQTVPNLIKTNIVEIDDMLSYMQSECIKNNIEFTFKLDCDINYILENFISKSQLETLLGDLIRNSIIAINHNSSNYKGIMVVFGIKDDFYELCVFDSGIPFKIDTLLNLGIKPASTHINEGGTGIGFITTFETVNSTSSSLIIHEFENNYYTKSIEVRFDNKNEYVIISNRVNTIKEKNTLNRDLILKADALI